MTGDEIPQLVDTEWLAARLDAPDLRVLDCTVHLEIDRETGEIHTESGRDGWVDEHVPGSVFVDVLGELSETEDPDFWLQAPDPRPELFADREEVLASIDDGACRLVNALRTEDHLGDGPVKYGRPGRIPSSVNVPAAWENGVVDPDTAPFRSREELRRTFARVGATDRDRVITYCGGGIAASSVAFALDLIGVDDVAVYDGSLAEWGADPDLPMTTG